MWQYNLREKRLKSLVLFSLWVKWVVCPPLWYTLVSWVRGFSYHLLVTPFLTYGPSSSIWSQHPYYVWYLDYLWYDYLTLLLLLFHYYVTTWTLVPYSKCTKIYFMFYNHNHLLRPGKSQETTARDSSQSAFPTSPWLFGIGNPSGLRSDYRRSSNKKQKGFTGCGPVHRVYFCIFNFEYDVQVPI